MAAPTTVFKNIDPTLATTALDTLAERLTQFSSGTTISTGAGNEWNFGTIDISGGAADSAVKHAMWKVTVNGGNTLVDTFKLWISTAAGQPADQWGFAQAGTVFKAAALKYETGGTNGVLYVASATTSSYASWVGSFIINPLEVAAEPGAQNVYAGAGGTSCDITTIGTTEDVVGWEGYLHVAAGETTGTYKGLDSGKEFRANLKFSYS